MQEIAKINKIPLLEVTQEEYRNSRYFSHPSNFYLINAMGNRVYIKTSDKVKARSVIDEYYGKGFYNLRMVKLELS